MNRRSGTEGGVHSRLSPDAIKILLSASSVDPRSYAYEATPLFDPYNHVIYAKADNPDPTSFRPSDKDSPCADAGKSAECLVLDKRFLDVGYENELAGRAAGEQEHDEALDSVLVHDGREAPGSRCEMVAARSSPRSRWPRSPAR